MMPLLLQMALWAVLLWTANVPTVGGFKEQVFPLAQHDGDNAAFEPYEEGFVGYYGTARNPGRYRVNQGGQARHGGIRGDFAPGIKYDPRNVSLGFLPGLTRTNQVQRFLAAGLSATQVCPSMVGPMEDGAFYCTSEDHGFCDRRTGVCWCYDGYSGLDCSKCAKTHFMDNSKGRCVEKISCPFDCNGAGLCDYITGTCNCFSFRSGEDCSIEICTAVDPWCESCKTDPSSGQALTCLECIPGYFVNETGACVSCSAHDPRCVRCNSETCIECGDPLLQSIRRSGRRKRDPYLPFDELSRELSMKFPFGSKSPDYFDDAEVFQVVPLISTKACKQAFDASWTCTQVPQSHVLCGHVGTFEFSSPTYAVLESSRALELTVRRSGGGYGAATVMYAIIHESTDDSDLSATAWYTSSQRLHFDPGVVSLTFCVTIHDDSLLEIDETFSVVLYELDSQAPGSVAHLGAQHTARVTILDDDYWTTSGSHSIVQGPGLSGGIAGEYMEFSIQPRTSTGRNQSLDEALNQGETFVVHLQHPWHFDREHSGCDMATLLCKVMPTNVGERGTTDLHVLLAKPGGLRGEYFENLWFQGNPVVERTDAEIDFTWDTGPLMKHVTDFVSVRWFGGITAPTEDEYRIFVGASPNDRARLWIDGDLILDFWDTPRLGNFSYGTAKLHPYPRVSFITLEYRHIRGSAQVHLQWIPSIGPNQHLHPISSQHLFQLDHLSESPYENLVIADSSIAANQSFASGLGLTETQAGKITTVRIHPRDRFGNPHNPALSKPGTFEGYASLLGGGSIVHAEVSFDETEKVFWAAYRPHISGEYHLSIILASNSEHIMGSPFLVKVEPGEIEPSKCDITGIGALASELSVGEEQSFQITIRDQFTNLNATNLSQHISVVLYHSQQPKKWEGLTTYLGDGVHQVDYAVTTSGLVHLHVLFHGSEHMAESPYDITFLHGPAIGYTSLASGPRLQSATSGTRANFTVHARDEFGNPAMDTSRAQLDGFRVEIVAQSSDEENPSTMVTGSCVHTVGDLYLCEYIPTWTGTALLSVYAIPSTANPVQDKLRIAHDLPYQLNIYDGTTSATQSLAKGPGVAEAVAGEEAEVNILARDSAGNIKSISSNDSFRIVVTPSSDPGKSIVVANTEYKGDGLYKIVYVPTVAGVSLLTAELYDPTNSSWVPLAHAKELSVTIHPASVDGRQSIVFGDGLANGETGAPIPVGIQAKDRFGNNRTRGGDYFQVLVRSPRDGSTIAMLDAIDQGNNGIYDATYTLHESIPQGSEALSFRVAESKGVDVEYFPSHTVLPQGQGVGTDVVNTLSFDWTEPAHPNLVGTDVWSARWKGMIRTPAARPISGMEFDNVVTSIGRGDVSFFVTCIGGGVRLWLDGTLVVDEWPIAKSSLVSRTMTGVSLLPDSFHSFQLEFTRHLQPHQGAARIALEWSQENDWAREPISSLYRWRPVSFRDRYDPIIKPSSSAASQSSLTQELTTATAGSQSKIQIQLRDGFGNDQWHCNDNITVRGWHVQKHLIKNENEVEGVIKPDSITCNSDGFGLHAIRFTPTLVGKHNLYIAVNMPDVNPDWGRTHLIDALQEYSISGSPFTLDVMPNVPSGVQSFAFGPGLNTAVVGEVSHFFIQSRDAESNNRVGYEDDIATVSIVDSVVSYIGDGLYRVEYTPQESGVFEVVITLSNGEKLEPIHELRIVHSEAYGPTSSMDSPLPNPMSQHPTALRIQLRDKLGNMVERGGDSLIFDLRVLDVFTGQSLNEPPLHVNSSAQLNEYEYGNSWTDYIHSVEDFGNGTYLAWFHPIPGDFQLDIKLAHGSFTPGAISCSFADETKCAKGHGGLLGQYYDNQFFKGNPTLVRVDNVIDLTWDEPLLDSVLPFQTKNRYSEEFLESCSVRWDGFIKPEYSAEYEFLVTTNADDRVKVQIGGHTLIDRNRCCSNTIRLRGGILYPIVVEMQQSFLGARLLLEWGVNLGSGAPNITLPESVTVSQFSRHITTSIDLAHYLFDGDIVRIGNQQFTVIYHDHVHRTVYLDSPYLSSSGSGLLMYRRPNISSIPPEALFHGASPLQNSPLTLSITP